MYHGCVLSEIRYGRRKCKEVKSKAHVSECGAQRYVVSHAES
jgi:hypothetical protein